MVGVEEGGERGIGSVEGRERVEERKGKRKRKKMNRRRMRKRKKK
jgi:hypothetical protein